MKKRILAFMLCGLMVFSSIPLTDVGQLYTIEAAALNLEGLRSAYESAPAEETWGEYIDVSLLRLAYDYAEKILEGSVTNITQEDVDECAESLRSAIAGLKKHTTSVGIFPTEDFSVDVGKSKKVQASLGPVGAGDSVSWAVSNTEVAKIEKISELEALITVLKYAPEGFTVTATSNGITSAPRKVTTVNTLADLTLSYGEKALYEDQEFTLTYKAIGADSDYPVTGETVTTWSTSNPAAVRVDDNGKVTALTAGKAEITLEVVDAYGNVKTAKCDVTVLDTVKITGFEYVSTLTDGAISMSVGKKETFKIRIKPETASVKAVSWTSSNKNIARVSDMKIEDDIASATIEGIAAGRATITYEALDGSGKSGSFDVIVKPLASSVNITESFVLVSPTTTGRKLTVKVSPDDADHTLQWKSTNSSVCAVDAVGTLFPKASGVVTITASTDDGSGLSDSVTVRVADRTKSVTLNKAEVGLDVGETSTLKATVTSLDGSVYNNVVWSTENSAIAKVSTSGVITAVGPGQTVITATAYDTDLKFASCVVTVNQPLKGISLASTLDVEIGDKETLKVTYNPSNASNKTVSWKSSNTKVATVSSKGVVTGIKEGTVTITCTSEEGGLVATCKVRVVIPASGVSLNKKTLDLMSGETYTLKATVTPEEATDKTVKWTSSNTAVATVSSSGKVTAKAGGTCTISAKTSSGGHVAKCTVNVTQTDEGVELNKSTYSIYTTGTFTLKATVLPSTATNKSIKWTSSNTSVATVSSAGKVTGVKAGTATITAETASGNKASCLVEVYKKVNVTGLKLEPKKLEMQKGETASLSATITPSNASEKGITWTTSDKNIATVSSKGVVSALKTGKVTITAETKDGAYTQNCEITIIQSVTGIGFVKSDVRVPKGKSLTMKAVIEPSDATNKNVTWMSTDESVAKVSSKGIITGVSTGNATIIATTEDGDYSAACNVTVYIAVSSVKLNAESLKVPTKDSRILIATVSPSNAENKEVEWSTSNKNVVTVSETGAITAKNPGTAKITVKTVDGDFSASCVVEVVRYATDVELSNTKITIDAGKSKTLTATVKPSTASDTTVKYKTSDKKIATVSSKGVVKAVSAGKATITVTSGDGNAKAYCTVTVRQPATGISVSAKSMQVKVGELKVITATVKPDDVTDGKVSWSSSNKEVATVDSKGVVKGLKVGKATITAKTSDGKFSAKTTVTVIIPVKSVKLNKTSVKINVGKTTTLTPKISPSDATIKDVKWSSNNNDVATVSSSGKITAKAPGYAKITCTTKQGSVKTYCEVLVIRPVTGVKLNKTSITVEADEPYTLKATVKPSDASNKSLKWSSSDSKIAKVSSKGVVTGLKSGTVTITAKTVDGSYKAKCTVKVIRSVTGVELNKTKTKLYLGKTLTLKASVEPSDATNKAVKWYSSDESIATVSSSGKVTPKKVGTVTITVKTSDGGYKAKCVITVMRAVESIKLNKTSMTLNTGKSYTLKATLKPDNATDKSVKWTTSNSKVATVSSKGVVKAVSKGTATITATTENGLKATFKLTVYQPVTGISIRETTAVVYAGEQITLKANALPSNANEDEIKWKSSNTDILTVSSKGVVTGKKAGIAEVTAETKEGGYTAKCIVTVKQHVTGISIDKKEITLIKGRETDISVTVAPENATDKTYTIVSSNPEVATVDEKGHIVSLSCGTTLITVTSNENNKSATCSVNVVVPVSGVSLSRSELEMFVGTSTALEAVVSPSDAHDKSLIWTSTDDSIVSVSEKGVITANKSGTATITVTTNDGGFTAECVITSLQRAESIEISDTALTIIRGEGATISAAVMPEDSYDRSFTWSSDNEAVAKIDAEGNITTYAPGVAVITATSYIGGHTANCTVTVHEPLVDFTIDQSEITLYRGQTKQINATFNPENASNKKLIWASDDERVATVSDSGVVTVVGKGRANITATSEENSELVKLCTVTGILAVESIVTEKEEYALFEGETLSLGAYALPEGAENPKLIYSSNDEAVATVSQDGIVTAVTKGPEAVQITITSEENSQITKTVLVTVMRHVTGVTLNKTEHTLAKGEMLTLIPTIAPASADIKDVEWSSSDESVATVAGGVVTAVARGEADITVTTKDGGKTAICKLTVIQLPEEITFTKTEFDVQVGEQYKLEPTVLPENTNDKSLTWESLNKDIATVDVDGTVRGIAIGDTTIVAKTVAGQVEKSVTIHVVQFAEKITPIYSAEYIWVGQQVGVEVTVTPENTTDKTLIWESLNTDVVTVDRQGTITAVGAGRAQVAIKAARGNAVTYLDIEVRQQVTDIALDITEKTIDTNEEFLLTATVLPENAYDKAITWFSDNDEVATVDSEGRVKGIAPGTATITAVSSGESITATCTVTVIRYIDSISITENDIIMKKGDTKTLITEYLPLNATETALVWLSSDDSIVSVSETGEITALKGGRATVKAITAKEEIFAETEVTVDVRSETITLSETAKTVYCGEEFTLISTILPEDTLDKTVIWSSDNEAVATVVDGVVTPLDDGIAVITAKMQDSGIEASCEVTVLKHVSGVEFDIHEAIVYLGDTHRVNAQVLPEDASNKKLIWSTSDEEVATVADGVITPVGKGNAIIIATTEDGSFSDYIFIEVQRCADTLTLSESERVLAQGESFTLTAVLTPDDTDNKELIWTTTDEEIATVSEGVVVAGRKAGTAVIRATAACDGELYAECRVSVKEPVTAVNFDKSFAEMRKGDTFELSVIVLPENASVKTLEWATSDEAIATVTVEGNKAIVTAVDTGNAIITATSTDSGITASCNIKVLREVDTLTITAEKNEIKCGESTKVSFTAGPEGHDEELTYSLSDDSLAVIDEEGNITAKDLPGVVKVTVTASVSGKTAECEISIFKPVEGIIFNITEDNKNAFVGKTDSIAYIIDPENASNQQVIWTSSNNDIASVDINSGVITYKAEGEVTITATTLDGAKEADFTVTVKSMNNE